MIRLAVPGEEAELDAFLAGHSATSMFLRNSLAAHGLSGPPNPFRTTYWRWPETGPIRAVLGHAANGMLLPQATGVPEAIADFALALRGRTIVGAAGEAGQTDRLLTALRLPMAAVRRVNHEPLLRLDLARLPPAPPDAASLRRPLPGDATLLSGWFDAYLRETGLASGEPGPTAALVADRVRDAIAGPDTRLLVGPEGPLAMAALNARVARMVQVGGVFVPPPLRGRGLGREVTRALLAEMRAEGMSEAVLFANNEAAARAYRAIGFAQIGWYRIAFLRGPFRVGETT
ncbi:GNAT family N-acetyltransferase [Fuscovulum blasticum]|uniref:GNAT family N-acetyltransferase n=1 Tax=Fuscovulum blasticum TaxID=1075 RepID=UPI000F4D9E2D|nr:GNAT family N-acetyltransferase [Fuscovulum blasticum]